ncbi:hypothetical protein JTE90_025486 [Oedothorax gibbosus]|uniref:Uncharacterized protein n=1 Tax=Oedothorax gibbosus TaxID=931172 RepID=A0AAV6UZF2_9ARAC|nr:hypothetical protein JTE90_025486 [Oedothorax gibbosus]
MLISSPYYVFCNPKRIIESNRCFPLLRNVSGFRVPLRIWKDEVKAGPTVLASYEGIKTTEEVIAISASQRILRDTNFRKRNLFFDILR